MYSYETQMQKALRLSEESFKKEEELRKQALKIEKQMVEKQKWDEEKSYNILINLMKWQPMFIHRGVGSGLQNLGNSCFMNATLQCLAYTPAFAQLLCQSNHSKQCKIKSPFCSLCEMEKIIPNMLMSKQIIKPKYLFKNLSKINDLLTPGCQEDAHEFIQSLLDKIEIAYDDQQKPYKKKDKQNPIRKLFTGATKTTIQCAKCKKKSVRAEPFCCISLEVDDNVGLDEALEIFTQDELMRGDDKYFCNNCKRKCIAHKRLTLSHIPPIFIIHLKRFCIEFSASHHKMGTMKKLHDHVEFPEILSFNDLKHLIYESDRELVLSDPEYELYGVLVHSGPQLGYGHYYSLIKSPDGYWFRMNDMDVIPINTKRVLREQGYILFYKRTSNKLMNNQLNKIKQEKEQKIDIDNDNNNNGNIKVDVDLATKDYFANNCNNKNKELGMFADRIDYVKVPQLATRPELNDNQKKTVTNKKDNDAVEIFWPPKESE
eukprot:914625_1